MIEFYFFIFIEIKEWFKVDIFLNRFLLYEYLFIIKYLVGYRYEEEVVKVYFLSDDERVKIFFKDNCKVLKEIYFEFINVEELKVKEEDEKNEDYERKVFVVVVELIKEDLM